jgi:outer membrane protein assembly factor BamD
MARISFFQTIKAVTVFAVAAAFFISAACQSTTGGKHTGTAEQLLHKGIKEARKKRDDKAKELFNQVLEDYPDSEERIPALLLLADTLYKQKEYEEAKFNYKKFTELYPAHPKVDHAHYYKAMCDYKAIDIAARDQTPTQNALEQFEFIITQFPNSLYHAKAEARKLECLEMLAQNIMTIGRFYFRAGAYESTIHRMIDVMEKYPNQKFQDEALYLLAESYYYEQNFTKAGEIYGRLIQQYPKSAFAKEARARMRNLH